MQSEGSKVDAYVFMHLFEPTPPRDGLTKIDDVLDRFRKSRPYDLEADRGVRFAYQFVGSFVAFGAVTVDSLKELQELIAGDFWTAGVRSEWSVTDLPSRYGAPHKHSPPIHALVRIRTGTRSARSVLDALDDAFATKVDPLIEEYGEEHWREHFYYAAATVSGKGFDILVELADNSLEELKTLIFERIGTVDGVASTDSAFAYIPEYEKTKG